MNRTFAREMAVIRPFRAWRYNEEVISDIHRKFSPLFDVVSPEELKALYEIPNNSIHLSVPESLEDARHKLSEWKSRGVIRQDPVPGIYIFYQYFWLYGEQRQLVRKGFISLIRMTDEKTTHEPGTILHEDTIAASVRDRTEVLEATLLNVAPTHGLYEDPAHSLERLMDKYMEHPVYEHIDYQGVVNRLAIVHNKTDIDQFLQTMKGKPVYLADGHHRYASSLLFRDRYKQVHPDEFDPIANYHLIYLTNLYGSDISILPIHRVVKGGTDFQLDEFLARMKEWFDLFDLSRSKVPLFEELKAQKRSFGMSVNGKNFLLSLKENLDPSNIVQLKVPDPVKRLDYTLLHYLVFDKGLGIPYEQQGSSDKIQYIKDYSRAIKMARENPGTLAFITSGLSLNDMLDVCNTGSLMPQKSTYFYPKVICGLVFASIDEQENNSTFDSCFRLAEKG